MTPQELKALLFLAVVAVIGAGVRVVVSPEAPRAEPAARRALRSQLAAVDSARRLQAAEERERAERRAARAARGAGGSPSRQERGRRATGDRRAQVAAAPDTTVPVDVDRADSAALESLPGIGPALAGRIVRERETCGPYGSLEGLERVRGVGPALSKRLAPRVTFSLSPRPSSAVDGCGDGPRKRGRVRRALGRS